jgi:hypothetical protein
MTGSRATLGGVLLAMMIVPTPREPAIRVQDCQAVLVPCNQAHRFTGEITINSRDELTTDDHKVRNVVDLKIRVVAGRARCSGTSNEREETKYRGVPELTTVATGLIDGPGLIAIEFTHMEGRPVYTMKYACPSARVNSRTTNERTGESSTEVVPSEPADWRNEALAADPQPAPGQAMPELSGTQRDLRQDPNEPDGITTIVWLLRRIP